MFAPTRPRPSSTRLSPPGSSLHVRRRRSTVRTTAGFTLFELAAALVVMAVAASLVVPALGHLRDRLGVWSAREKVVALLGRARAEAPLRGGASVEVLESPSRAFLLFGPDTAAVLEGEDLAGSELIITGPARRARLAYDALGVGRMASRSLDFRRGRARAGLVISSYGRVRRR